MESFRMAYLSGSAASSVAVVWAELVSVGCNAEARYDDLVEGERGYRDGEVDAAPRRSFVESGIRSLARPPSASWVICPTGDSPNG